MAFASKTTDIRGRRVTARLGDISRFPQPQFPIDSGFNAYPGRQQSPFTAPKNENYYLPHSKKNNDQNNTQQGTYAYAINLRVNPVELGFMCGNSRWHQEFKGLNAFNQYFGMLTPNKDGYTLPDVWDGYYQITLVKFSTKFSPEELKREFASFYPSLDYVNVKEALFRSSKIVVHSGEFREANRRDTDFIALFVNKPPEFQFEPLLQSIRRHARAGRWNQTPSDKLHINIRKYPVSATNTGEPTWTLDRIEKSGIADRVARLPLDFYCATLEIVPARRLCVEQYRKSNSNQWWSGVTDLNGQCSGCQTPIGGEWKGACLECGQYEWITPIWSVPHLDTVALGHGLEQVNLNK